MDVCTPIQDISIKTPAVHVKNDLSKRYIHMGQTEFLQFTFVFYQYSHNHSAGSQGRRGFNPGTNITITGGATQQHISKVSLQVSQFEKDSSLGLGQIFIGIKIRTDLQACSENVPF